MAEKTIADVFDTMTEEQKRATYCLVGWAWELGINYLHGYCGRKGSDQKTVVDFLIDKAIDEYEKGV